ncbi:MAG: methyltransferase domain-containing protein [Gammaproteobacteria bacterium]|nr:methyltransferase domain-containing protein [Pseudomonadales bacterium]MCP5347618.1 methyltransferase domain-containing protein [Pseudomonadales bacterium]
MSSESLQPASLVEQYLPQIGAALSSHPVLDLACGSGRNGLFLARHKFPVIFADINPTVLEKIARELTGVHSSAACWEVDLENPDTQPLAGKEFDVILVFNYLHRPLIPAIRDSLVAGGLLLYETFTVDQAKLGRPRNPDFLLKPGELRNWFDDWEILSEFEGFQESPPRCYASLVARKPGT